MSTPSSPTRAQDPLSLLSDIAATLADLTAEFKAALPKRPESLMTVDDVAAYLSISRRSVEQLIAEGHLVPLYVLSVRRFTREAVDAYLRGGRKR